MRRVVLAVLLIVVLTFGGDGAASSGIDNWSGTDPDHPLATISAGPLPDWTTYHGDPTRSGRAPAPAGTGGTPTVAWRAQLDGAVYGQPLVVGGRVAAATENDSLYALDPRTGRVRWRTHVGSPVPLGDLPCGNIDPLGLTGTPVYDPATRLVFAVAETTGYHHRLVGVDIDTGAVKLDRDLRTPDGSPRNDQQRSALLLAHNRIYIAFGGLFGDCGPYIGSVVAVPTTGTGPVLSYRLPTSREGGIWAPAGPTLHGDTLYVAVGNGAAESPSDRYDGTDSVVALDPQLHRVGYFAPRVWPDDNSNDLDLGSMSPVVLPNGRVLISGKRGTGYLLRSDHLGGIGGELTSRQTCRAFGGAAYQGTIAYLPCTDGGPAAVDTTGDRIQIRWRGPAQADGSPVLVGDALWIPDTANGVLYTLDAATGRTRHTVNLGDELPHFASPTPAGSAILVGTMHGVVAVSTD